ncbi:hypothetical protein [Nocardiopsis ansamitocini]|uniref:Uncharacterized protein n=1 Tax=Nocardiopsis ansamitocini TaxID=1670832 RepID=A0A9W6UIS3_9ACTN|nr:hypothetical protein [Nocardiopsis ansamitocini]GLU48034.1 hypothetical protein Nans01_23850 [Nocardiopsis ansamitocini]
MAEFMRTLHLRIHDAVESLRRAHRSGDEELVIGQAGEIEDLVEIAARHGVDIDGGYQELTRAT